MVTERTHRMTELFGRLASRASVESARAELTVMHAAMMRKHPEAYSARADVRLSVTPLRDQLAAPARPVLRTLRDFGDVGTYARSLMLRRRPLLARIRA